MSPGAGVGIEWGENHQHKMKEERNEEIKGDRENILY